MKTNYCVVLLSLVWLFLLGCPPNVPNIPADDPALKTQKRATKVASRRKVVVRKAALRRKVAPRRRGPKPPPGTRFVQRGKDGKIKSRVPGNLRRYTRGRGGRVKAVYFEKFKKPDPLAVKLCHALHVLPKQGRKSCCKDKYMLYHAGKECLRTVTAAIRAKAVIFSKPAVARCVAALHKLYEGCEWVGFWPSKMPAVCYQITRGTLQKGKRCRSGLECGARMYCHGLGTTVAGRCWTSLPNGSRCGTGIDPLGVYLRQNTLSERRSQCQGVCVRTHCAGRARLGAACRSDSHCAEGLHCAGGKCAKGAIAASGQPCSSRCAGIDRCLKGVCTTPRKAGSKCTSENQCRGGCLKKKGQKVGVCGIQCAMIRR